MSKKIILSVAESIILLKNQSYFQNMKSFKNAIFEKIFFFEGFKIDQFQIVMNSFDTKMSAQTSR